MRKTALISILIPTLNRSDFLVRALFYYSKVGFKGYVCIGDSSEAPHTKKVNRAIQRLRGKLKIIYRTFPNPPYIHDGMVTKELIELAPTPYAVYAGDDDFVIPRGLEQCAAFLEDHPEYSAAHGVRVVISLQSSGAFGQLASAYYSPQPVLESERASDRWAGYMRRAYSTQYSVHRTKTWRRMYRDVASIPLRYLGPELLPCSFSCILGKIKELNCLSVVMQENDVRMFGWDRDSIYSFIIHPDWSTSVQVFRNCIVEALTQREGIDVEKAQEIFDRELWYHLSSILRGHYRKKYPHSSKDTLEESLQRIPGLATGIRLFRQIAGRPDPYYKSQSLFSLDSLLNPSSPFCTDFMPIYHAIVDAPPEFL